MLKIRFIANIPDKLRKQEKIKKMIERFPGINKRGGVQNKVREGVNMAFLRRPWCELFPKINKRPRTFILDPRVGIVRM